VSYPEARDYVKTDDLSGVAQLALLLARGLQPHHRVLEIGCGALHLARPLVTFLDPAGYVGLDPNYWLREAAVRDDGVLHDLLDAKGAQFSSTATFRSPDRGPFDFVFSHSVLSHATRGQLVTYLAESVAVLKQHGLILASLNLGRDTDAAEWTYPMGVWFSTETVNDAAASASLDARRSLKLEDVYQSVCPLETHNWIEFIRCPES
jgi:cyclopropane fatty-acyl-phospholipid synthase-like methyltransferase